MAKAEQLEKELVSCHRGLLPWSPVSLKPSIESPRRLELCSDGLSLPVRIQLLNCHRMLRSSSDTPLRPFQRYDYWCTFWPISSPNLDSFCKPTLSSIVSRRLPESSFFSYCVTLFHFQSFLEQSRQAVPLHRPSVSCPDL